jgi:hypothetical protein
MMEKKNLRDVGLAGFMLMHILLFSCRFVSFWGESFFEAKLCQNHFLLFNFFMILLFNSFFMKLNYSC